MARSSPSGSATVEARTLDFDATAPSGYSPIDTTEGETTKMVTVMVNGDTEVESDEFFLVVLFNPVGVDIAGRGQGHHRRRRRRRRTDHDHHQHPDKHHHHDQQHTTTTVPLGVVTIDDTVVSDGSRGRVTGSVTCDAGRVFVLQLSLTQGSAQRRGQHSGHLHRLAPALRHQLHHHRRHLHRRQCRGLRGRPHRRGRVPELHLSRRGMRGGHHRRLSDA